MMAKIPARVVDGGGYWAVYGRCRRVRERFRATWIPTRRLHRDCLDREPQGRRNNGHDEYRAITIIIGLRKAVVGCAPPVSKLLSHQVTSAQFLVLKDRQP